MLFCGESRAPTLFYFLSQVAHGFLGDDASFASCEGLFCDVDRSENFGALTLTFFPECERLAYGILFAPEAAAFDGIAYESFLVGG